MIEILLAVGLLIVSAATVLLFAMVGHLATLISAGADFEAPPFLKPLEGAQIGITPSWWPDGYAGASSAERFVMLVLSTSCRSCDRVADQLRPDALGSISAEVAIVLACPHQDVGEEFVLRHNLGGARYWIDAGGRWLRNEVGITSSPACLIFEGGSMKAALAFSDLAALRPLLKGSVDNHLSILPVLS